MTAAGSSAVLRNMSHAVSRRWLRVERRAAAGRPAVLAGDRPVHRSDEVLS